MSCRGNKTVQVKEQSVPATAPSTAATTTTTSSTSATKVKETAVLDKETKPSLMKSSEENKENTSSKNKQKSAGLCGGNRNEVRHDVLTPVPPTLNVGTVGGQKGVENITSPGDTSNSKRADDTHTQKAKVSEVLTKQSSQTDRAVDLKEKQLYDGKKVEERNQVEKAKLVKTKSGKGGSKNVQVQEKKVTSIENKQIVLTNDKITKSSAIKNEQINEKLVEKEMKVSELETEIKDTHQSPSKQSSINFEKIDIDGNPSTSIVSSDQIIENDKIPRKTKGGLCWSSSSVNVKDSVSQKRMSVESQKTNENTVKVNRVNAEKNINTGKETDLKKRKEKQKKVVEEITEFEEDCDSENQLTESLHESLPLSRKAKASTKKKDRKTYVSDEPAARRKSFAFASKKGKYSVSTEKEGDDPLYASIKPSMKANKKKDVTQPAENNQEETDMEEKPGKKIRQDTPQKKRRKKALDTNEELRSVYESQMASLQTKTFSSEEYTLTSQPTVEEEGDLLENAEEERKKNKQRLREKKKSEQGALSHPANLTTNVYESAQREIDKVLGPRLSHDSEGGHEKKQEKKRKKKAKKGKENEAFVPDEPKGETLEEARERMHKLLDDAFSLISHSKSSISNKVQPVDSSDAYSSSTSKHNTPRQDHSVQADLDSSASEEKKHTPINVQRTHEPYDSSGLITWSPYRASDEIATISLPSTQTNLSSQPPQQEKLTTSTFVETAPSRKNSYLATEPGKPIVIKTKNFEDSLPPPGPQKHKGFNGNPAQHSSDIRTRQETFQNPVYENTLPLRTMETYSEPYHGLASYQDLPVSHLAGKVSNGRPHVRQSAWQEERSKLADMAPLSLNASPRDVIDVRSHTGPQHGEKKHFDEVDVITESLRPGASPQPLINSLRDELQSLSSKRQTGPTKHTNQSGSSETKRLKDYLPSQLNTSQAESESSWGSMHRNTSKV